MLSAMLGHGKDSFLSLLTRPTFCREKAASALKFEPLKRKRPQNWRLLISVGMQSHRNKPLWDSLMFPSFSVQTLDFGLHIQISFKYVSRFLRVMVSRQEQSLLETRTSSFQHRWENFGLTMRGFLWYVCMSQNGSVWDLFESVWGSFS